MQEGSGLVFCPSPADFCKDVSFGSLHTLPKPSGSETCLYSAVAGIRWQGSGLAFCLPTPQDQISTALNRWLWPARYDSSPPAPRTTSPRAVTVANRSTVTTWTPEFDTKSYFSALSRACSQLNQ